MSAGAEQISSAGYLAKNPFVVESPEKLTPEQIVSLFVKEYTRLETVKQRRHTFIWGSRGSGKSMMLRYLEPQCQAIAHESHDDAFGQDEPYLAVYCPCKEGYFNKTELELLDASSATVLSEHLINLAVAGNLVTCLMNQFPKEFFNPAECSNFVFAVSRLFDPAAIGSSFKEAKGIADQKNEPLSWLKQLFLSENRKISAFLRERCLRGPDASYKGATSGYHDFLLPVMRLVSEFTPLRRTSVYVLLDDADRLTKTQQSIVNNWIANRDQAALCLKVSAQRESYKTFRTPRGALIEQPHDYSEVDVEELYTTRRTDYYKKIKLISEKRLQLSDVPTKGIEEFLPVNPTFRKSFFQFRGNFRRASPAPAVSIRRSSGPSPACV